MSGGCEGRFGSCLRSSSNLVLFIKTSVVLSVLSRGRRSSSVRSSLRILATLFLEGGSGLTRVPIAVIVAGSSLLSRGNGRFTCGVMRCVFRPLFRIKGGVGMLIMPIYVKRGLNEKVRKRRISNVVCPGPRVNGVRVPVMFGLCRLLGTDVARRGRVLTSLRSSSRGRRTTLEATRNRGNLRE